MALAAVLFDISNLMSDLLIFITPLWIAFLFGLFLGWSWRPAQWSTPPTSTSISFIPNFNFPTTSISSWRIPLTKHSPSPSASPPPPHPSNLSKLDGDDSNFVEEGELEHLCQLVEEKDGGGLAWIPIMDRSTPNMTYQAWRRDPQTGPPQYRSTTVYEDVPPELMRDFFWDDEFRLKWDDMLIHAQTLEDSPTTGTMVVKWVRKFPFFCSDREYIIGRRIWESGRSYYCVTKGVQYPSVPRRNKPRRVDLYYSSWCIRAVESRKGDGQLTSCEVILFHHEDMGIPWEIAKLGVRQGMWGAVTKIDRGLRSYQRYRASGPALSHCAFMAQINTKVSSEYLRYLESSRRESVETGAPPDAGDEKKPAGRNIRKVIVVGGAIAVACTLDRGLLTKAVIFGVARRFAKIGRRL